MIVDHLRLLPQDFFKQKTAYEIHERLVGSEMCIRDRFKRTIKSLEDSIAGYLQEAQNIEAVSYTHLTLPTTPYV